MRARPLPLATLAACALLLAACSSGDDDGATPTPAPPTVTVTETVTETVTPTGSPTASASAAAGDECATADLGAKVVDGDSGAGQRRAFVVLTNTSDETCTLTGYPGLQLVAASGANVPTRVVRVASPAPRTVKVAPGSSASSTITFGVVATGSEPTNGPCRREANRLRVIPPDARTALTAAWDLGPVCNNGRLSANAFVAGDGG